MDAGHPMDGLTGAPQCTATSKQSKLRCKRRPIPGGTVCVMHGGRIPQVMFNASQRIAAMVPKAMQRLNELMDTSNGFIRYKAIKDCLDRAGHLAPAQVDVRAAVVIRYAPEMMPPSMRKTLPDDTKVNESGGVRPRHRRRLATSCVMVRSGGRPCAAYDSLGSLTVARTWCATSAS